MRLTVTQVADYQPVLIHYYSSQLGTDADKGDKAMVKWR